jgi:hypothetical protein
MLQEVRSPRRMRNAARKHLKEMRQLEFAILGRHTAVPQLQPADSNEFAWSVMRRYIELASHITAGRVSPGTRSRSSGKPRRAR